MNDYDNVCSMDRACPRGPGALTELPDQCQTQPATLDTHNTLQSKYLILFSWCSVIKFIWCPKLVTLMVFGKYVPSVFIAVDFAGQR